MPNILTREQVERLKDWEYLYSYGYMSAIRDLIATLEVAWEEQDKAKAQKGPLTVYSLQEFFEGVG